MRIDIFTLFPAMFAGPFGESIIKRALVAGLVDIAIHDLRDWTADRHRTVDDTPYGGGAGMVMMAPPIVTAVESVLGTEVGTTPILLTAAGGEPFAQPIARELAAAARLAIICGHYEGIDARVSTLLGAREVSVGDYVLTGGELPAMVITDAVVRLLPGVIDQASLADESHERSLLEYPHYTRPAEFRGLAVPEILFSGHHAKIAAWRRDQAIRQTAARRPDLLARAALSPAERASLAAAESAGAIAGRGTGIPERAPDS